MTSALLLGKPTNKTRAEASAQSARASLASLPSLPDADVPRRFNLALVTARGFPDVVTRLLGNKLVQRRPDMKLLCLFCATL